MKKPFIRIAILFLAVYMAGCAFLSFSQKDILYHPGKKQAHPASYGLDMDEILHKASDGTRLLSWYKAPADDSKPVFIFFHGNAGHLGYRSREFIMLLENGIGLFALGYRGFGKSEGYPSEQGIYTDARSAIESVKSRGFSPDRIVLYGESLGSGVAIQMATEFNVKALILESPYTSMVDVGRYHYPFVPVDILLDDKYESLDKVAGVSQSVLILHGTEDNIVPYEQGVRLFKTLKKPAIYKENAVQGNIIRKMITFEGKGHNNHDISESFREWVKFLDEVDGKYNL